jgi:hypothetical protein
MTKPTELLCLVALLVGATACPQDDDPPPARDAACAPVPCPSAAPWSPDACKCVAASDAGGD